MKTLTDAHYKIAAKYPYEIQLAEGEGGFTVQLQPRDGTRYVFAFRKVSEHEADIVGCSPEAWLVSMMTGAATFKSTVLDLYAHPSYIAEKLDISLYVAGIIKVLFNFVQKQEDPGPFPYERRV